VDKTIAINMPSVLTASVHSHAIARAAILEMDFSVKVFYNKLNPTFTQSVPHAAFYFN